MESQSLEHAKQMAVSEATIKNLTEEKKVRQEHINEANEKQHQAELKEAIAKTKAENSGSQLKSKTNKQ